LITLLLRATNTARVCKRGIVKDFNVSEDWSRMTPGATHEIALDENNRSSLHPKTAPDRNLGEHGTFQIYAVAGFASSLVAIVKIVVASHPATVVHVVKTMGAIGSEWQAALGVADGALDDFS
jgi:hypothetical protein